MDSELVAAIRAGDRERALRALAAGAKRDMADEQLKAKGNECFRRGEYNAAIGCYKQAIGAQHSNRAAVSRPRLGPPSTVTEARHNTESPWRKCTHGGRACYVRNLRDFDGNNLPDDDWTLGLPHWHWHALSHTAHPLAAGVKRFEGMEKDDFAKLLGKAQKADDERKAAAIQALWGAALKVNRVIARRAASMPKGGHSSGWRGGKELKAARLKVKQLCPYEFGQFVDKALFAKPRLATRFFQLLDEDGDDELNAAEWRAGLELLCDPGRRVDRVSFLFDLMDPAGSGQKCQAQVTGLDRHEGRQIDEAAVDYFFRKYLVPADDTVDAVLESVELYFGLAPQNAEKRGDGRKVPGAHRGMLGTHRPTARAVGLGDQGNQGLCDEQGLEHADYFRHTDKQEHLDRARKRLGRHNARYREASTATIELRSLLSEHADRLLARSRKKLARDVFQAADLDRSGAIDRGEFGSYIQADPRLLQWLENTGSWWVELGKQPLSAMLKDLHLPVRHLFIYSVFWFLGWLSGAITTPCRHCLSDCNSRIRDPNLCTVLGGRWAGCGARG